ncbi:hypothetical protein [Baekduia sp.]|uniref:hypothetical protein n=1 Tax=Baekduia sp. TaxID=2600305 RepID=UPI002E0280D6|nr:hypothetical protein [Baekduia sp.]
MAAAVMAGVFGVSVSSASAAAPTGDFVNFKYCPYTNVAVDSCMYSRVTSGSFTLGNASVPITSATPIVFQGGFTVDPDTFVTTLYPAVGADTLVKQPIKVPGGLIGLVDTGGFSGLLISLFNAAVASVNDVYATAELAGTPKFDYINFVVGSGTTLELPLRIHLENPFLGSNCYIGSTSTPVVLKLTDGTTAPPLPNTPISGDVGTITQNPGGSVTTSDGAKLVDNAFSVPAASNCGYLLPDMLVITTAVNLKEGLPAAAGKNTAIMQGQVSNATRSDVQASVQ